MIYNLHFLRVIAALAVVYFHMTSEAGLNLSVSVGSRGVDVFFVISGFIIAQIGMGKKPGEFLVRRLIRVVPFYWGATLFVFGIAFVFPALMRSTTADTTHLLYSLFFIPHFSGAADGMFPTLILGWSLNFEMYFYVVFAVSLALHGRYAPLAVSAFIGSVVLLNAALPFENPILQFYGRPITLEFVFGVLVFYICRAAGEHKAAFARLSSLKWHLIITLAASVIALCAFEISPVRYPRYIVAGVPAFFIVLSSVLLERIYGIFTKNSLVQLLGESSYIVYLIHPYIVYAFLRVVVKGVPLGMPATVALIVGLLALTCAASIGIHVWFERPVMSLLRQRLLATQMTPRHASP